MRVEPPSELTIRGSPEVEPTPPARPAAPRSEPIKPAKEPKAKQPSAADGTHAPGESKEQDVQQVLKGMNSFLQATDHQLQFALHKASEQMMVRVVDGETEEVIKTIPAQELLDLQVKIGEMVGTLIDKKT